MLFSFSDDVCSLLFCVSLCVQDLPTSLLHEKIFTAGREVPNDATILDFKRAVRRFLRVNKGNGEIRENMLLHMDMNSKGKPALDQTSPTFNSSSTLTLISSAGSLTDKLIGVHCTHGLNRTGYLICR